MDFKTLGLNSAILEALGYMGFENATPIQEQAIPHILNKQDLLACAQTGTGKTAAFILPVLQVLSENPSDFIGALVIAPTRELAIQIEQQIQAFAYFVNLSSIAIYGGGDGQEFTDQKKALKQGTDIIVATPGKLLSHINMGYVNFKKVKFLILDEADRMLDMGFHEDITKIVKNVTPDRQTLLFSATMPPKIRSLSKALLKKPQEISLSISKPAAGVLQAAYLCYEHQKAELVKLLIDEKPSYERIIIFSSTKKKVREVVRVLQTGSYNVQAISSDLEQKERVLALRKFKSKETRVLVATDVLSRGIDIKDINLVINYDVPGDAEDYVHRIGRTARADTTGVALTLINEDDMYKFHKIEKLIEMEVMKVKMPEKLGEGPAYNTKPTRGGRGGYSRGGNSRGGNSNRGNSRGGKKNYSNKKKRY